MILADTSLWIDFLRGTPSAAADELDDRLAEHEVLMCGPVATEILRDRHFESIADALGPLDVRLLDG